MNEIDLTLNCLLDGNEETLKILLKSQPSKRGSFSSFSSFSSSFFLMRQSFLEKIKSNQIKERKGKERKGKERKERKKHKFQVLFEMNRFEPQRLNNNNPLVFDSIHFPPSKWLFGFQLLES